MGAGYAHLLDELHPGAFGGIVLFYGEGGADLSESKAQYQCHFAEDDDWEPLEYVKQMKAPNAEIHIYPGCYHWFFESNRLDHYNPAAAEIAWMRTLEFLHKTLAE
jgi:carboxymethylenebutenolidase